MDLNGTAGEQPYNDDGCRLRPAEDGWCNMEWVRGPPPHFIMDECEQKACVWGGGSFSTLVDYFRALVFLPFTLSPFLEPRSTTGKKQYNNNRTMKDNNLLIFNI
uniref:Uncharacterized protein n=1 Tax=Micrurus spixii TaxID=129469 RepID=A0A2D4NFH0_9SAUR